MNQNRAFVRTYANCIVGDKKWRDHICHFKLTVKEFLENVASDYA